MKKLFAICVAGLLGFNSFSSKAQDLTLEDYFTPVTAEAATPDSEGFICRWMLLEPISKPNRGNTVFTDSYLRQAFDTVYYKDQKTILPKNGQKVTVVVPIEKPIDPSVFRVDRNFKPEPPTMTKMKLTWHALDSKRFNVKLFRFATGLKKQFYGIIFHAVTIIDCEEDIENVRLAVGSNSASMRCIVLKYVDKELAGNLGIKSDTRLLIFIQLHVSLNNNQCSCSCLCQLVCRTDNLINCLVGKHILIL